MSDRTTYINPLCNSPEIRLSVHMEHGVQRQKASWWLYKSLHQCCSYTEYVSERVASQRYRSIHLYFISVPLAWCLEGDRRVSAVLLPPPPPPPGGMSYNKHRQQFTHTESCNCVQMTIHLTLLLHRRKNTSPSNPYLITDTSALQHTGATATYAETSLLILN